MVRPMPHGSPTHVARPSDSLRDGSSPAEADAQRGPASLDDASRRLNAVGLRATGPRLEILEFFGARDLRHASADDIFRALRDQGSDIALGTVYRVLSHLTDVGLLTRCIFEAGIAVYELQPECAHDHLVCLGCGRIEEFADPVIDERRRIVAQAHGFASAHRQLAFYGYCPSCRLPDDASAKPSAR